MNGDSYCDVTERLFAELERVHPLPMIAAVVRQCRQDLEGAPSGALPELLERLARQRLTDLQPSARRRDQHGSPGEQPPEVGVVTNRAPEATAG